MCLWLYHPECARSRLILETQGICVPGTEWLCCYTIRVCKCGHQRVRKLGSNLTHLPANFVCGKLPNLSEPHCLHLLKGNQSTCFVGMLRGLNEKVNTRHCMTQKVAAAKIITNMTSGQTEACTGPAGASLVAQG